MTKSKRVMRRLVLSRLYDHLQDQYSVMHARDAFINGELSIHEVDALLAFRSDPCIEELRNALSRIENGTYGVCISCKTLISQDVLNEDPAQRICTTCEKKFVHTPQHQYFQTHTTI